LTVVFILTNGIAATVEYCHRLNEDSIDDGSGPGWRSVESASEHDSLKRLRANCPELSDLVSDYQGVFLQASEEYNIIHASAAS
jgi:hypothetical protein